MSVLHFKPELWSKILLGALEKNLVFGGPMVVNRDYEGEISGPGDTVHITSLADPTISSYTPNSTLTYQTIVDAGQSLQIDQAKSWSVSVDDVDRRQAMGDMQTWMEGRAAYRVADTSDQFLAALYTGAASANVLASTSSPLTPGTFTTSAPADFYTKVVLPLKVVLGQQNVPDDGNRYLIVPPWGRALIEQTQAFIAFPGNNGGPGDVMQNGYFGKISGFNLMESNNAVNANPSYNTGGANGVYVIQAGHNMAITYAEQIVQTEALRAQATFADLVRGLHVYGAKVVRPEALAVAYTARPPGI
jgi:hypothetical protein